MENDVIKQEAIELIKRRREQMFVHSYLYYSLGTSAITDDVWQDWANGLRYLQERFGTEIDFYDEQFKDWTGDTGMHLKAPRWAISVAESLKE